METQKKNYVLPIAMMFALFAMISFVTGLQNPMGIIVKNQRFSCTRQTIKLTFRLRINNMALCPLVQ